MQKNILEDKEDRLLSTKQAAEATDFHQTHINRLLMEGRLKGTKGENGRWQLKQSDLDKYMASNDVKPRRSKRALKIEEKNKPGKTLLTQLDEKNQEIDKLKSQILAFQESNKQQKETNAQQIESLEAELDQLEKQTEQKELRLRSLEERNKNLEDQLYEHNQYVRTVLTNVLDNVMGNKS